MERKLNQTTCGEVGRRLLQLVRKYRYVALVLLIGAGLLLWPSEKKQTEGTQTEPIVTGAKEPSLEETLKEVLATIDGAGRVEVILTYDTGMETVYETQRTVSGAADGTMSEKQETVVVSQGSGSEAAVPVRTIYPRCRGALIVCEGADNSVVRLAIKEAVSCLTGLGTDRISVVKRQEN